MITKQFDEDLYNQCDQKSKKIAISFFEKYGFYFKENPDKYDVDLININFNNITIELEWRPIWKNNKFPYDTIHIPERKNKYIKYGNSHYMIFNFDYTYCLFTINKIIKLYLNDVYEIYNKEIHEKEYFFNIPIHVFTLYKVIL